MKVEEALYFFRKNKNLKQKDILTYTHTSVYSRIENGKKLLKFSELRDILERLSVPLVEFSEYLDDDLEQKYFRGLLQKYKSNAHDLHLKEELLAYYHTLNFSEAMTIEHMSNYVVIKTLLSSRWNEIPALKQSELDIIFNLLNVKEYFFQYDYALLSHTIFLFDRSKIDLLTKKALPVKNMSLRNTATKEFIKNMINNLITTLLRKKEYELSTYYLTLAASQLDSVNDLSYKIVLDYLKNLTQYLYTGDKKYKTNIFESIDYLNKVGEHNLAVSIKTEVESILLNNDTVPIFIQANL
ncbi:hypothetical protein A5819_003832 [Enterococcus sp. 7E2_DIV0204]|uniref:helix-turn-helix domain-containing protein n=1 Tax=Enterococcus sp. 7E2_DIV0204 TaxID=1834188 RepID=UPI000A342A5E|nr:helix-turn-helix transcriptional regulator [Enterococcus sp. 7E2_DIV0204]OTN83639.1 hypothetical protein A5819_003832 [Enterococcus sp. 7E2_DIV0204]